MRVKRSTTNLTNFFKFGGNSSKLLKILMWLAFSGKIHRILYFWFIRQLLNQVIKLNKLINYEELIEFLDVIAIRRLDALSQRTVCSSQQEDNDEKRTLLAGSDFESHVFEDQKKSVDVLDERQERTWADYRRYDLSKIKECLVGIRNDQFFNDLQNLELQSRVDKLLLDIDIRKQIKSVGRHSRPT